MGQEHMNSLFPETLETWNLSCWQMLLHMLHLEFVAEIGRRFCIQSDSVFFEIFQDIGNVASIIERFFFNQILNRGDSPKCWARDLLKWQPNS